MKKHEAIKVKLVDGTVKTVLIDLSSNVAQVVESLSTKIGLKTPEEFSLQLDSGGKWSGP